MGPRARWKCAPRASESRTINAIWPPATVSTAAMFASGIVARRIGATSSSRRMPAWRSLSTTNPANIAENGSTNTICPIET